MKSRKLLLVGSVVLLAAVAALGFFAAMSSGAGAATAPARVSESLLQCGTCHAMTEEVTTWQSGPHADVACLQCHVEGDPGWIRHEFADKNPDMASHPVTTSLHTIEPKLDGQRCEQCHEPQMTQILKDIEPAPLNGAQSGPLRSMGVKAAHDLHLNGKADLACTDCHDVHGAAPGTAARQEQVHRTCQECHDKQQVTLKPTGDTSCTACHLDATAVVPADHQPKAQWQRDHGKAAVTQSCTQCHTSDKSCTECHAGEPMPHPAGFLAYHGQRAVASPAVCTACHSSSNPARPDAPHASAQFCADCHAGQPMPHPDAYLSAHGGDALKSPAACQACHSGENPARPTAAHASGAFCAACHDAYQHPAGWVASHGTKVNNSCTACHSTGSKQGGHNACSACHTSEGSWHPTMWFVSHGKVVNTEGKAACMKCHNEVQPACTQCHRNP